MGFIKSSCSFTRYTVTEEVPASLWGEVMDRLRKHAFREIDDTSDERSWGWVSFDDMLDAQWRDAPPQKGAYIAFSLRLDTRRIPPAVLKKYVALALREEEARNREAGKKYVSRERKKELREHVQARLMQRCLPIPAVFEVVWNMADGTVFFASVQPKMLELFEEYFSKTFELDMERLTPYGLAAKLLGEEGLEKLDRLESTSFA